MHVPYYVTHVICIYTYVYALYAHAHTWILMVYEEHAPGPFSYTHLCMYIHTYLCRHITRNIFHYFLVRANLTSFWPLDKHRLRHPKSIHKIPEICLHVTCFGTNAHACPYSVVRTCKQVLVARVCMQKQYFLRPL
jgi:hypothetical protein